MRRTPADSLHLRFKESRSTSRIDNPSSSILESRTDVQLPQELITEILLRLPVKSLLKFKCVSKPWLCLISSPQFIRSHFSISSMEGEYLNLQLLFTTMASMKQCSLYSAMHEAEPSRNVADIEFPSQNYFSFVVGIVNGLVCLVLRGDNLYMWNPVLKKVEHLPDSNVMPEAPFTGLSYTYGFGYDESNDDYKVVCLLRKYVAQGDFEDEVKVYSLRADSWRIADELKGFRPTSGPGLYANGKIYWSGCVYSTPKRVIVSLDIVSEKYGELQHPNDVAGKYDLKLGVVGGRLCLLCDYEGRKADLWVLDKYGVEESWCKLVSIPYGDDVDPQMRYCHHRVVCILSNGEIVLANRLGLLVYNSKKKEFRKIGLDVGISSYVNVSAYVESLVWPYA